MGFLHKDQFAELMTTRAESLTQDELNEMFEKAVDPHTKKTIDYEYYINQLIYEPQGENNLYNLADRIEAEKPPPPPPPKRFSQMFQEMKSSI